MTDNAFVEIPALVDETVSAASILKAGTGIVLGAAGSARSGLRTWQAAGISASDALRIQNAATKSGQTIIVVGSRAKGTAHALSDWDYILTGATARQRDSVKNSLPRGIAGGDIYTPGIEFFQGGNPKAKSYVPLIPERPHVIFNP